MYYPETDTPAMARTSNLNEELGQVRQHFLKCLICSRKIEGMRARCTNLLYSVSLWLRLMGHLYESKS